MTRALFVFAALLLGIAISDAKQQPVFPEDTFQADGVKSIAGGSLNPPDPVKACDEAKDDAKAKAATAGYKGKVEWQRLSADSDCSLSSQRAGGAGYFYIFTAKGTFHKN